MLDFLEPFLRLFMFLMGFVSILAVGALCVALIFATLEMGIDAFKDLRKTEPVSSNDEDTLFTRCEEYRNDFA